MAILDPSLKVVSTFRLRFTHLRDLTTAKTMVSDHNQCQGTRVTCQIEDRVMMDRRIRSLENQLQIAFLSIHMVLRHTPDQAVWECHQISKGVISHPRSRHRRCHPSVLTPRNTNTPSHPSETRISTWQDLPPRTVTRQMAFQRPH